MIQFYAPDIEETLTLPESDSQHCIRVLRMKEGDAVQVIDGHGHTYDCRIVGAHQKHTALEIVERHDVPLPWSHDVVVAVAPTKHMDRMEWMVEKLTEIGVNRIIPLLCDRSERKEIKVERLEKIAVSAMKQSLKAVLPKVDPMTPVREVLSGFDDYTRCIAYCDDAVGRTDLTQIYRPNKPTIILIGPEGDFSPREVEYALSRGWIPVTLGPSRLRTETAAVVACDTMHILNRFCNK